MKDELEAARERLRVAIEQQEKEYWAFSRCANAPPVKKETARAVYDAREEVQRLLKTTMKTQAEVRQSFWDEHPGFKTAFYRKAKRQNSYPCTVRSVFVEFVDHLQKSGVITQKLAGRVTL